MHNLLTTIRKFVNKFHRALVVRDFVLIVIVVDLSCTSPTVGTVSNIPTSVPTHIDCESPIPWAIFDVDAKVDSVTGLPLSVTDRETGIEMILITPGEYVRGATPLDEPIAKVWCRSSMPAHRVRITHPFYLGKYEVTLGQYSLMGLSDVILPNEPKFNLPIRAITWNAAAEFCETFHFRLPTEAEWEYAARAGTQTSYPWGDDLDSAPLYANVMGPATAKRLGMLHTTTFPNDDAFHFLAPVGSFKPNAFGLYDMIGNVQEYCSDWEGGDVYAQYDGRVAVDPTGPEDGPRKIVRGGSFLGVPDRCRISFRWAVETYRVDADRDVGFRVAKSVGVDKARAMKDK